MPTQEEESSQGEGKRLFKKINWGTINPGLD